MSAADLYLKKQLMRRVCIDVSLTRPADTTAYAQADAVANATSGAVLLEFPLMAVAGGAFELNRIAMIDSAAQTVKPDFDLWLFDTAITAPQDNAAWAPSDAEMLHFVAHYGIFGSPHFLTGSGNGVVEAKPLGDLLVAAAGDTKLYGVVRVGGLNGYTPIASENFTFRVSGYQYLSN